MNAISVSVKTNTVLVCKTLAEAQFRCLDCSKAFISERHLVKHSNKRHCIAPHLSSPFFDANNDNERKLIEVTGRLEKAVSLLDAKTSSLDWTSSQGRPEDTFRECQPINFRHIENKIVEPQKTMDVRKTVSLFTLPNYGINESIEGGWMPRAYEEQCKTVPIGDQAFGSKLGRPTRNEDTGGIVHEPGMTLGESNQEELVPGDTERTSHNNCPPETPKINGSIEVGGENQTQPNSIEALLIDLIKKLDSVFSGNRQVLSSQCQTSQLDMLEQPENNSSRRKSVRFSDSPLYYDNGEQNFHQSESECSSSGTICGEDRSKFNENDAFQTYTKYSAESQITRPVYHPESACKTESADRTRVLEYERKFELGEDEVSDDIHDTGAVKSVTRIVQNQANCIQPKPSPETCRGQSHLQTIEGNEGCSSDGQDCSEKEESQNSTQSRETAVKVAAAPPAPNNLVSATPPTLESAESDRKPSTTLSTNAAAQKSAEYLATKRQILEMVEKCVKDIKHKRLKSPQGNCPGQNRQLVVCGEDRHSSSPEGKLEVNRGSCSSGSKNFSFKTGLNAICIGRGNITTGSQGISPPCTMICRDEEADVDELSGDSYERFMKRFYGREIPSQHGHDESSIPFLQIADNAKAESSERNQEDHRDDSPYPKSGESIVKRLAERNSPSPVLGSSTEIKDMRTKLPSNHSELKKTDYAVLLHDETSQVQSLIDTLVTDLQRWRNIRQDRTAHAIRLQLEERLTSSLNLLGIQSDAKLLSDSAAATAHFLLKNRRSKTAKVTPSTSSYFDVVKYAFVNEVDRIAKSRVHELSHCPPT